MTDGRRDYCPDCGVGYEPLQEYCLECGARLPTNRGVVGVLASSWQRRFAWYPGDWIWPVLLFLFLTIIATGAALAANAARESSAPTLVATGPTVTVGPGETGVDQERLLLAGDQCGRLVLASDGEVEVDDLEVEGAHGGAFRSRGAAGVSGRR